MQLQNIQITGGLTFIPEILSPSGDPYWANVSLLMNTTSNNNQTNDTFLDSSTNNFTVTRNGTTTQGSFTPFALAPSTSYSTSVNGGSGYFNGSSSLSAPSNTAFAYSTGDFTWELWVYMNTTSGNQYILDHGLESGTLTYNNGLRYYNPTTGIGSVLYTTAPALISGTWNHIAAARQSGTTRLFLNGTLVASGADTRNFSSAAVTIARYGGGGLHFNGYMASVRIVKGTAVYTSAFTPPTTPLTAISGTSLLLNFTNGNIFDSATKNNLATLGDTKVSTTQSKFAPTSVAFDGTGDYLTAPNNTALQMGTSDFTIEFWIYYNNITGFQTPFDKGYSGVGGLVFQTGNGTGRLLIIVGGTVVITEAGTGSSGTWIHYALVRSGTALTLYRDGVSVGTATNSTNLNNTSQLALGANGTALGGGPGNYLLNGYMQDVRVTKGVARYTAAFTPPTAPFPTN